MPELPEVEAVCRKLRKEAVGARIKDFQVFRERAVHPQRARDLSGAIGSKILAVRRRGKNILLPLSNQLILRVHLGMTGNLVVIPDARMYSLGVRVLFPLAGGKGLALHDTRIFGRVNLFDRDQIAKLDSGLGVEPLSRSFSTAYLKERASRSKLPAKVFLMDQKHVAGLGNIYSAEALFVAKISPRIPMRTVSNAKLTALHAAIGEVLKKAIKVTTKAYKRPGYFKESDFWVYGREGEPCKRCGTKIKRIEQAARSTFFCPHCQR